MGNSNLTRARVNMNDEFYTQLVTIEDELKYYEGEFINKTVYLNCDDARWSNFYKFFHNNFDKLGLKGLYSSHYVKQDFNLFNVGEELNKPLATYYDGDVIQGWWMKGDGDFRSEESIELLKHADIVVTNPPFSLFREYISQLVGYKKEFLVIGRSDALIYKDIFPLVRDREIWQGVSNGDMIFKIPNNTKVGNVFESDGEFFAKFGNIVWWTNLEHDGRYEDIIMLKDYVESKYLMYDNYNAINVDKVIDIPKDYKGYIGVPVSFISKWNPNQFELVGITRSWDNSFIHNGSIESRDPVLNGRGKYTRLLIQNKYLNPEIYEKDTEDGSANTEGEEI